MSTDVASSQRDCVRQLSPPWLSGGNGEKFLYNFGLAEDALLEKLNQAVRARCPTGTVMQGPYADASALPYIGLDRVLSQGPFETQSSFRTRLQTAFDAWQRAGSRRAVLQQVLGFFNSTQGTSATTVPAAALVSTSASGTYATWDTQYNTSAPKNSPAHAVIAPANWNWDGTYTWWRVWLVLYFQTNSTINAENAWGILDNWGDVSGSWGFNTPASTWNLLRDLISLWKSGNSFYQWIICDLAGSTGATGSEFSPNSSAGSGNPGGTWGSWGTLSSGAWVPSRASDSRYVQGPWQAINCFIPTNC